MTEAKFYQKGSRFATSVKGHADYDESGRDIVCAAVSMLTQTLIRWTQTHLEQIQQVDACKVQAGAVELDVVMAPEYTETMHVVMELIACGFDLLQEKYPEHVRVGRNFENDPLE